VGLATIRRGEHWKHNGIPNPFTRGWVGKQRKDPTDTLTPRIGAGLVKMTKACHAKLGRGLNGVKLREGNRRKKAGRENIENLPGKSKVNANSLVSITTNSKRKK